MQTVLFLCSGNFYRSRFSEVYFNAAATTRGLAWRAFSRGFRLHPGNIGPISRHTLAGLERLGLKCDEPLRFPLVASEDDLRRAAHIVAVKEAEHRPMMRAYFPAWIDEIEYWQIDDIDCAEPTAALSQLQARLDELLERLAAPSRSDA